MPEIKVRTPEAAAKVNPELPDAGYARDEELKARLDRLEAQSNEMYAKHEFYSIDPDNPVLQPDPEILKHYNFEYNEFSISDPKEGYSYLWVKDDHRSVGEAKVRARMLLGARAPVPGWEVVTGPRDESPECWELRRADGCRTIGDVVLCRMPSETAILLKMKEDMMRAVREQGVGAVLMDMADKYGDLIKAYQMNEDPRKFFQRRGQMAQMGRAGEVHQMEQKFRNAQAGGRPQVRVSNR